MTDNVGKFSYMKINDSLGHLILTYDYGDRFRRRSVTPGIEVCGGWTIERDGVCDIEL